MSYPFGETTNDPRPHMYLTLLILVLSGIGACCKPPAPILAYNGPTSRMVEVVRAINDNNAAIPSIWTEIGFEATLHDDKKNVRSGDGYGVLMYRKVAEKPDELLLRGSNDLIGTLFEIGSTSGADGQYWCAILPNTNTEWFGYYKHLDKPCAKTIPIQPYLVTEVLGVGEIDENFMQSPMPVMQFNNEADAYVLLHIYPSRTQFAAQKEVWYDRKTSLPKKVKLFDGNGRVLLQAILSNHQILEGSNHKMMATKFDLFFPDSEDRLIFDLKGPKITHKNLPKAGTIQRRSLGDDVKIIRIDEDCGD